ncbi:MAG: ribonuclease HII [Opitutaceae bacterium]
MKEPPGKRQRRGFDLRQIGGGHGLIGVDEAGRGALAGPVVAGAVLVNRSFLESDWCRRYAGVINDSKQLTPRDRVHLYTRMDWLRREGRILFAPGLASVAEIESENILGATKLAMRRAVEVALEMGRIQPHPPDPLFAPHDPVTLQPGQCISDWLMLVDGKPMRDLGFMHRAIVEGDAKSLVIAMASIVAKVTRDRLMEALEVEVPGFFFARHKGYATHAHREALLALGPTLHHRKLFITTFLAAKDEDVDQTLFEFAETEMEFETAADLAVAEEAVATKIGFNSK